MMLSQWALKRVYKFVLKRLLGKLLQNELDLQQLDVQLGAGTLELKDLQLNTDYLNDQLGNPAVLLTAGYVGTIKATIPWTSLATQSSLIELHDLELILVPQPCASSGPTAGTAYPQAGSENEPGAYNEQVRGSKDGGAMGEPYYGGGSETGPGGTSAGTYLGVDDGVRGIARVVERILLGLRVKVKNLVVRVQEPGSSESESSGEASVEPQFPLDGRVPEKPANQSSACALVLRVSQLEYGPSEDSGPGAGDAVSSTATPSSNGLRGDLTTLSKCIRFTGATLQLVQAEPDVLSAGEELDCPEEGQDNDAIGQLDGAAVGKRGLHASEPETVCSRSKSARCHSSTGSSPSSPWEYIEPQAREQGEGNPPPTDGCLIQGQAGGLHGVLTISLPWREGRGLQLPSISVELSLGPVKVSVYPRDVKRIDHLTSYMRSSEGAPRNAACSQIGTGLGRSPADSRASWGESADSCPQSAESSAHFGSVSGSQWGLLGSPGGLGGSRPMARPRSRGSSLYREASEASVASGAMRDWSRTSAYQDNAPQQAEEAGAYQSQFLPVTRFISNWMHWAGSEDEGLDQSAQEADLAASMDEFFDCLDSTLNNPGSISGSGLWNWTCTALTAITTASSLAAGAPPVPQGSVRPVEYSVQARVARVALLVFYKDPMQSENMKSHMPCHTVDQARGWIGREPAVEELTGKRELKQTVNAVPFLDGRSGARIPSRREVPGRFGATEMGTCEGDNETDEPDEIALAAGRSAGGSPNGWDWAFLEPGKEANGHHSAERTKGAAGWRTSQFRHGEPSECQAALSNSAPGKEAEEAGTGCQRGGGASEGGYLEAVIHSTDVAVSMSDGRTVLDVAISAVTVAELFPSAFSSNWVSFDHIVQEVTEALPEQPGCGGTPQRAPPGCVPPRHVSLSQVPAVITPRGLQRQLVLSLGSPNASFPEEATLDGGPSEPGAGCGGRGGPGQGPVGLQATVSWSSPSAPTLASAPAPAPVPVPLPRASSLQTRQLADSNAAIDVTATMGALTVWLDLQILTRVQALVAECWPQPDSKEACGGTRGSGTGGGKGQRVRQEETPARGNILQGQVFGQARHGVTSMETTPGAEALHLALWGSSMRVVMLFPDESVRSPPREEASELRRKSSKGPFRDEFLVLDLTGMGQDSSSPRGREAGRNRSIGRPLLKVKQTLSNPKVDAAGGRIPADGITTCLRSLTLYLLVPQHAGRPTDREEREPTKLRADCLFSLRHQQGSRAPAQQQPYPPGGNSTARPDVPAGSAGLVEVRFQPRAETGSWLSRRAWDATMAQRKRADGGSGVGGGQGGDFAAAAVGESAAEDLQALEVREQVMAASAVQLIISLHRAEVSVAASQLELLTQLAMAALSALKLSGTASAGVTPGSSGNSNGRSIASSLHKPRSGEERFKKLPGPSITHAEKGREGSRRSERFQRDIGQPEGGVAKRNDQIACLVSCAHSEVKLFVGSGRDNEAEGSGWKAGKAQQEGVFHKPEWGKGWNSVRLCLQRLLVFHAASLGGLADVSYTWLQHQECRIFGCGPRMYPVGAPQLKDAASWRQRANTESELDGRQQQQGMRTGFEFSGSTQAGAAADAQGRSTARGTVTPGNGPSQAGTSGRQEGSTGNGDGPAGKDAGDEWLLFECSQGALGRGDGGSSGGNALARGIVGTTITHVAWPGGGPSCDAVLAVSLRGGTLLAHGGRVDWLLALQQFVADATKLPTSSSDRATTDARSANSTSPYATSAPDHSVAAGLSAPAMLAEGTDGPSLAGASMAAAALVGTVVAGAAAAVTAVTAAAEAYSELNEQHRSNNGHAPSAQLVQTTPELIPPAAAPPSESRAATGTNGRASVYLLLDLYDVALAYEPGLEVLAFSATGGGGTTGAPAQTAGGVVSPSHSPVGCVLAAAAVRVAGDLAPGSPSAACDIWLRDAALSVMDTRVRAAHGVSAGDYTRPALRKGKFIQVVSEAVMEAHIQMGQKGGPLWELSCANSMLRLETCRDTTASMGRLAAQLQQLLTADVVPIRPVRATRAKEASREASQEQSSQGGSLAGLSGEREGGGSVGGSGMDSAVEGSGTHDAAGSVANFWEGRADAEARSNGAQAERAREDAAGAVLRSQSQGLLAGLQEDAFVSQRSVPRNSSVPHDLTEYDRVRGRSHGVEADMSGVSSSFHTVNGVGHSRESGRLARGRRAVEESLSTTGNGVPHRSNLILGESCSLSFGGSAVSSLGELSSASQAYRTHSSSNSGEALTSIPSERSPEPFFSELRRGTPLTEAHPECHSQDIVQPIDATASDTRLPMFIEDFYVGGTQQVGVLPVNSGRAERGSARGSGSRGKPGPVGRSVPQGGWYSCEVPAVKEDHVPEISRAERAATGEGGGGGNGRPAGGQKGQELSAEKKNGCVSKRYPPSMGRVHVKDVSLRWRLYGGNDWPDGDVAGSGGAGSSIGRQVEVCMEVVLDGIEVQHDVFDAKAAYASRLAVRARDVAVYDCSADAPWRMVMGYYRSAAAPRESSARAVRVLMDAVRPDPTAVFEEYRLTLALLPIRLHLDQHHIDFLGAFFAPPSPPAGPAGQVTGGSTCSPSGAPAPAMTADDLEAAEEAEALLPFFQICEMRPLTVRVDYIPRRVDLAGLRGGDYSQLVNLVRWKEVELQLKGVRAKGVHGWGSLGGTVAGEWLEDISQHQVHKFVQGVGPISPLYALGVGAAQLLVLPVEQYRRDRNLLKGMRKGATAFVRSVSLEALGLGAQLAGGAHELLQQAEAALGGASSAPQAATSASAARSESTGRQRLQQPSGPREGLQQACESLGRGLERSAAGLVGNPMKAFQRGAGAGAAMASAFRAAPAAAMAPASATAGALQRALLGVRNGLDPERKRESDEKHAGPPPEGARRRMAEGVY